MTNLYFAYAFFGIVFLLVVGMLSVLQRQKGWLGEKVVSALLRKHFTEKSGYYILDDVYLPDGDATTQIDHLVVSRYGVFVIETKNWGGTVYASAADKNWTVFYGRSKKSVQNPLRQNFKHMKIFSEITGIPENVIIPLIVVCGRTKFKTPLPDGVVYPPDIPSFFKRFSDCRIHDKQVPDVLQVIKEWQASVPPEVKKNHVANLQKRHGLKRK